MEASNTVQNITSESDYNAQIHDFCLGVMKENELTVKQAANLKNFILVYKLVPLEVRIHDSGSNAAYGYAKKRQAPNKRWVQIGMSNYKNARTKTIWAEIIVPVEDGGNE